jgi:hypothetical protein
VWHIVARVRIVVVACCLLAACGSTARDRALDEFVEQLVDDGGIERDAAQCIVDQFFDGMPTADVQAFFERDELTAEESVRFAETAEACQPGGS